ncbi:MAG: hypothetical protein GX777_10405 [Fastidiosipila sp.]|nr:hypothetical protein [Fastidiosipila sp.]
MSDNESNKNTENLTKRPKSRWTRRIIILVVVIAAFFGVWKLFTREEVSSAFKAKQVSRQNLSETLSLSGAVAPSQVQRITYKNIAVQRLLVQPGDRVQKGDQLLLYDVSSLRSDLNELKNSRDEAKAALESSQSEAADLAESLQGGIPGADLTSQLQQMAGDLTIGLSELAGGMLSIGNPFQQLVNEFNQIDFEGLNRLVGLMESLNERGEELLGILTDPDLQDDLKLALDDLNQRLSDLESILNELKDQLPTVPDTPTPSETTAGNTGSSPTTATDDDTSETTITEETSVPDPEANNSEPVKYALLASKSEGGSYRSLAMTGDVSFSSKLQLKPLSNGSMDMSQEELMLLMQQLQGIPGGTELLSAYQQGADLLQMLEKQIEDLEQLIETALQHEKADFDALVAEAQRNVNEIDPNKPLVTLYDESKPLVYSRVNRRDALSLEQGQPVTYTTDDLLLTGEVTFKSPVATSSSMGSPGQAGDLFSESFAGDYQSILTSSDPRVDVEFSLEGPDLDKVIFGFDISFEVDIHQGEQVLAIPSESLIVERGKSYVYVVNEDNSFELVPIESGIISREFVEIKSGLKEEDWVILNPPATIKEGVRYNVERQG